MVRLSKRMRIVAAITVLVVATLMGRAAVGAPPKDLVTAALLADVDSVKAGKPFTLGVLLKIKPGWHVYWKNPGDSGLPTRVTWKLPEGFTADELRFPIPTRFDPPGDIIGYGYHDELLLTATVTPTKNLDASKPLTFGAD